MHQVASRLNSVIQRGCHATYISLQMSGVIEGDTELHFSEAGTDYLDTRLQADLTKSTLL
jgi:hypothetical protein